VEDFLKLENRFRQSLTPEIIEAAQKDVDTRWAMYQHLATLK
jgi:pyruvate/2-oxoacid:ferredoxin oxidoreductase beta subunit